MGGGGGGGGGGVGGGGGGGGGGARGALDTNATDVADEFSTTNDERTRYHRKKFLNPSLGFLGWFFYKKPSWN